MKVIAQRGTQYLVTESEDIINPPSFLVDLSQNTSAPMPAQQALKWGYWEEPETLSIETLKVIRQLIRDSV